MHFKPDRPKRRPAHYIEKVNRENFARLRNPF